MAKTTVTVAVFTFLFAVAQARFSLDLMGNKPLATVDEDPLTVLAQPDTETEAVPESTAVVAWEPKLASSVSDTDSDFKSMTVISVRPAKRDGSPKLPFSFPFPFPDFRRGKQRRRQVPAEGKRVRGGRGTGYRKEKGSAEGRKRTETVFGNRPNQFPGRLMRLRNPGLKRGMIGGEEMKMRHRNNKHEARHNKHVHEHKRKHVHEHVHEKKHGNGIVKKIRKFLMSF